MNRTTRALILTLVLLAALAVLFLGRSRDEAPEPVADAVATKVALPRLVDLGSNQCIPCKRMAPILAELQANYADRFEVQIIDVREQPDAGSDYGIRLIPTQIFYDAEGNELWRHEGFIDKAAILARWAELGVPVGDAGADG